jgi:glycosyltransferase involved in cell wall biosynthesis
VHGVPFVPETWNPLSNARRIRRARPDVILSIDYRRSYQRVLHTLPRTPTLIWVRDPRTPEDTRWVATLRLPDNDTLRPDGTRPLDCSSLRDEVALAKHAGRPLAFAVTDPSLVPKMQATYGISSADVPVLPNPLPAFPGNIQKAPRPLIVFLGRLDPIKRPWLFVELARRFPRADFVLLGKAHFSGPGTWTLRNPPDNLKIMGHADDTLKQNTLTSAWVLVNTSIHEGLAISMLEALACETPLLATVDTGSIVSRFGFFAGRAPGAGFDGLQMLTDGLTHMLDDHDWRMRRGRQGRRWAESNHGRQPFLAAWKALMNRWNLG